MRRFLAVALLVAAACSDRPAPSKSDGPPKEPVTESPESGPGILAGKISFTGTPPPPRVIQVNKDEDHCGAAAGQTVVEVAVGDDGGLAGCVVEITGLTGKFSHPAAGYSIRQKGCRFVPHFQVIPNGAELTVHNDDPVLHNVNTGAWNQAQIAGAPAFKKKVRFRGRALLRVNCNVHSWMEAWLYVARSPFFAMTDTSGAYRIADVPPGTYKVTFTHAALGAKSARLEIKGGKTTTHDLGYTK